MIFTSFLPGVLKELLKHVPTVLFKAVEWNVLASELSKLSRRIIQKEGYAELFNLQGEFLAPLKINVVSQVEKAFDPQDKKLAAEKLLTLYFAQLFSPHGLFLDLGPSHLEMNGDSLNFNPSGIWTKFKPEFQDGIKDIYDGFYLEDEKLFHQGLIKSGLSSPTWPQKDRDQLAALFKENFGASVTGEMTFDMNHFKDSFLKVANFLLEKEVKISTDFLYLGIALVTMYSSLERTKASVNVKQIYLDVKKSHP